MPINLHKMAANTAHITITGGTLGDDTLDTEYYPSRVTEEAITVFAYLEAASTPTQASAAFAAFNEMLASLIKSWDVLEDDGTMFPIDALRFASLPLAFRMQVFTAIMKDIRPEAVAPQTNQMSNSSH